MRLPSVASVEVQFQTTPLSINTQFTSSATSGHKHSHLKRGILLKTRVAAAAVTRPSEGKKKCARPQARIKRRALLCRSYTSLSVFGMARLPIETILKGRRGSSPCGRCNQRTVMYTTASPCINKPDAPLGIHGRLIGARKRPRNTTPEIEQAGAFWTLREPQTTNVNGKRIKSCGNIWIH